MMVREWDWYSVHYVNKISIVPEDKRDLVFNIVKSNPNKTCAVICEPKMRAFESVYDQICFKHYSGFSQDQIYFTEPEKYDDIWQFYNLLNLKLRDPVLVHSSEIINKMVEKWDYFILYLDLTSIEDLDLRKVYNRAFWNNLQELNATQRHLNITILYNIRNARFLPADFRAYLPK